MFIDEVGEPKLWREVVDTIHAAIISRVVVAILSLSRCQHYSRFTIVSLLDIYTLLMMDGRTTGAHGGSMVHNTSDQLNRTCQPGMDGH